MEDEVINSCDTELRLHTGRMICSAAKIFDCHFQTSKANKPT